MICSHSSPDNGRWLLVAMQFNAAATALIELLEEGTVNRKPLKSLLVAVESLDADPFKGRRTTFSHYDQFCVLRRRWDLHQRQKICLTLRSAMTGKRDGVEELIHVFGDSCKDALWKFEIRYVEPMPSEVPRATEIPKK